MEAVILEYGDLLDSVDADYADEKLERRYKAIMGRNSPCIFAPFNAIIDLAVALHCFVDWAALTVHPAGAILCARLIYI